MYRIYPPLLLLVFLFLFHLFISLSPLLCLHFIFASEVLFLSTSSPRISSRRFVCLDIAELFSVSSHSHGEHMDFDCAYGA